MASGGGGAEGVNAPRKIQRLEEAVVNRIAAGEVVQRPANGIKEMMENCLDAGATSIQVVVKSGGLKLIQIQDNGCGIRKQDMLIVCERFTTSKLRKFEDLSNISTYGFRGEALASISHVAHVTITTRTADSKCAYKASYSDGKLLPARVGGSAEPRPCAGNQGTLIVAEDLFYNIPTRKRALKAADEYHRIADVITKYAVHNSGIAFTLKKQGEAVSDVRTMQGSSTKENISILYGASVGRELLPVSCENGKLGFKMDGYVTNANYSVKKLQFLLFINHRLVDSVSIRKAIEFVYGAYLPKNTHPFICLSIEIAPSNIDVNVHPTKHEVHFLHEDVVIESVQKAVEERLLGCNVSRTYYTQAFLPAPVSLDREEGRERERERGKKGGSDKPSYAYQMVRTDSKEQKLDAFVVPKSLQLSAGPSSSGFTQSHRIQETSPRDSERGEVRERDEGEELERGQAEGAEVEGERGESLRQAEEVGRLGEHRESSYKEGEDESCCHGGLEAVEMEEESSGVSSAAPSKLPPSSSSKPSPGGVALLQSFSRRKSRRREVNLTSILNLQHSVRTQQHRDLTDLFQNHKFVGCVDQIRALVQHQTKLYLVDLSRVTKELFYQLVLFHFANFGFLKLTPPAPVHDLVMLALSLPESEWTPAYGPKEKIAQHVADLLQGRAEMMKDYFSLEIREDGCIHSLPMLLGSYSPNLDRLPLFVLRLATEVNWDEEKECFQSFANECGLFYGIQYDPFLLDSSAEEQKAEKKMDGDRQKGEDASSRSSSSSISSEGNKTGTRSSTGCVSGEEKNSCSVGGEEKNSCSVAGRGEGEGERENEDKSKSSLYKSQPWRWTVEHVIFPALRAELVPQRKMATDGSLLQIADLHDLYKVFERC